MILINLLPMRKKLHNQTNKSWYDMMSFLLVMLLLSSGLLHWRFTHQRQQLMRIQTVLAQKIQQQPSINFKPLIKQRQQLLHQWLFLQHVAWLRPRMLWFLNELPNAAPRGIAIDSVVKEGKKITIYGRSKSHQAVLRFAHNLAQTPFWHRARLEIKSTTFSIDLEFLDEQHVVS